MEENNSSKIIASLITATAMVATAWIGYLGLRFQTEKPIYVTQTAEAKQIIQTAPTQHPRIIVTPTTAVSVIQPVFMIENSLNLPVQIFIDEVFKGEVTAYDEKTFTLDSYPVSVEWEIIKKTLSDNSPIGHDMGGTFNKVTPDSTFTIDNLVGGQKYFYPIISNNTDYECSLIVNKGWQSEYDPNAVISPKQSKVGAGYYELYSNSNVFFDCEEETHWWGLLPDDASVSSFSEKVKENSGIIYFTLEPLK